MRQGALEGLRWAVDPRFWPIPRRRPIPLEIFGPKLDAPAAQPKTEALVQELRAPALG